MKEYMITFRSITFAQRGERVLAENGYRVTLRRTPRMMERQGCGYCLKLFAEDITPAVLALRARKIPMQRVYRLGMNAQTEEVEV